MREQFSRTALLLGEEAIARLHGARVAVFGIGGVGGYVVEALARSGVGAFDLIDNDTVCESNLNRQIIATHETLGRYKVDVMEERILSINPQARVRTYRCFFLPETADRFDFTEYSYVVDAVDTVTAKLEIVLRAREAGVPVISCMGAGNKLDPTRFQVTDIYDTRICPLARVMRRELKKRGVEHLKVVYSTEEAIKPRQPQEAALNQTQDLSAAEASEETALSKAQTLSAAGASEEAALNQAQALSAAGASEETALNQTQALSAAGALKETAPVSGAARRSIPGSVAFVPSVAGLIAAAEVVKDLV